MKLDRDPGATGLLPGTKSTIDRQIESAAQAEPTSTDSRPDLTKFDPTHQREYQKFQPAKYLFHWE